MAVLGWCAREGLAPAKVLGCAPQSPEPVVHVGVVPRSSPDEASVALCQVNLFVWGLAQWDVGPCRRWPQPRASDDRPRSAGGWRSVVGLRGRSDDGAV
jgi:hypothetical protein